MKTINLFRSMKHDYALLGCFIFVLVSVGFIGYFFYADDLVALPVFLALAVVFTILAVLRFMALKSYFSNGILTQGVIVDIWFMKDRGRVTYSYEVNGQLFTRGNAIMRTKETKVLVKGKKVDVLVKSNSYKKAIIVHLYS